MPNSRPPFTLGIVAAAAAVGLTTLLVYPLKQIAADISLSVVYLLAVLFVASLWGARLAIATALASALRTMCVGVGGARFERATSCL